MKNILKNAKFRDEFLTKGGNIVVFWQNVDQGITCFGKHTIIGYKDGNPEMPMTHNDSDIIISRYQEHIDEEKIYLEARKNCDNYVGDYRIGYLEGYKDGYCKAMEELI